MEWIGVIGIVVGLVFFVVAAMRGWNVLITSIVTAIVIALTNGMDIMSSMVGTETSYVTGLAGFLRGNLIIFMGGAIMGEFMDKSGAAKSIAQGIMNKVGTKSPYMVLLGISLIGALLTYAGISMFVAMFALIPLARPMFRECDIPWPLLRGVDTRHLLVHHGDDSGCAGYRMDQRGQWLRCLAHGCTHHGYRGFHHRYRGQLPDHQVLAQACPGPR